MQEALRFQCRHIHVSGLRCASPSLRQEHFCYFHHTSRKPISQQQLAHRRGHQSTFTLPSLEDRPSIQLAIAEVLSRIASGDLDPKRAGLLLYGLQIASGNLPREVASDQPTQIEEITMDEHYGPLAPETEFQEPTGRRGKSLEQILREQWARDEEEEAEREAKRLADEQANRVPHDQANEESFIVGGSGNEGPNLPTLQAVATRPTAPRSTPNPNPLKILRKTRGGGGPLLPNRNIKHLNRVPRHRMLPVLRRGLHL